jgi:uncharacterized protein (TIGR02246 family)
MVPAERRGTIRLARYRLRPEMEGAMSEHIDLIDAQVKAFQSRDLERFVGFYASDAVIKDGQGNVMMNGSEAIRGMYGQLFQNSPNLTVSIPSRMVVGDYVIDEEQLDGFILPGSPDQVHSVVVYRIGDGVIQEVTLLM